MQNRDLLALKNYVTAQDGDASRKNPNVVVVDLTHSNLKQRHLEIRFDVGATVADVATAVYRKTGTPPRDQYLQVYLDDAVVYETATPEDDTRKRLLSMGFMTATEQAAAAANLGAGNQRQQQRIHCIDTNPHSTSANGGLEDVSLVRKFEISEQQYDTMDNTVRAYKRKQKLQAAESEEDAELLYGRGTVEGFEKEIGSRCEVQPGGRRGWLRWVGQLPRKPGWWIGVELDEPVGSNDGSLDGHRYFDVASPRCGCFVRGPNAQVGDFPERDIFDDEDDSDDEI